VTSRKHSWDGLGPRSLGSCAESVVKTQSAAAWMGLDEAGIGAWPAKVTSPACPACVGRANVAPTRESPWMKGAKSRAPKRTGALGPGGVIDEAIVAVMKPHERWPLPGAPTVVVRYHG
jgi:hypothetical protein